MKEIVEKYIIIKTISIFILRIMLHNTFQYYVDTNSYTLFSINVRIAVMAEWLRRWTRNPMGSSRAGSNPARSD